MQSSALPTLEDTMSRFSRKALRAAFVAAVVLAAVAVASPIASASRRRTLMPVTCTPTAAHWYVENDDLGLPQLSFAPATRCPASADSPESCPASAHPGWSEVTDDLGISWLVPNASADSSSCRSAQDAAQPGTTQASPYPGWVFVTDDLGVPWLTPLSNIR
jgi:hypothetical protein